MGKKKKTYKTAQGDGGIAGSKSGSPIVTSGSKLPSPTPVKEDTPKESPTEAREEILRQLVSLLEQLKAEMDKAGGINNVTKELLAEFRKIAESLVSDHLVVTRESADLVRRHTVVARAEQERDEGFAREREALEQALSKRREEATSKLEVEIANLRELRFSEVAQAELTERARLRLQTENERTEWDEVYERQRTGLTQQMNEIERQRGATSALQSEIERRRVELERNEFDLEEHAQRVKQQIQTRRENIDREVAELLVEDRASFQSRLQSAKIEGDRLREAIQSQDESISAFRQLQQQLGGREPTAVIDELKKLNDLLVRQREELASRPSEEMRAQLDILDSDKRSLQNRVTELSQLLQHKELQAAESGELKSKNAEIEALNRSLERKFNAAEKEVEMLDEKLSRLLAAYARPADIKNRYEQIELALIDSDKISRTIAEEMSETEWLNGIAKSCTDYGLHFNSRILKAFHTALKTAEWSPLTVLAGVSGTGKSELPRLYSHFGGLYFEPLSVQPNWDSQESMLGFFNSIDNRFDAQPILRFLAQSQKSWVDSKDGHDGYPGLKDRLCLVLLDEMNLAHPELYFAEFLSKLELRRGKKNTEVPSLLVKIGAGLKPYELKLGRNVLWAGTMNQDETTKSLSDKVLDRSVIIYFPRPSVLRRRKKLIPLDANNRGVDLPVKTWNSWKAKESTFEEEDVRPYKSFIETMNESLSVAGRAIGHRVWQSVEYYMANYPDVREAIDEGSKKRAMHIAFEDQLVQKVMPKLRGIDTRGKSRELCLDKIREQIVRGINGTSFNLSEDFDQATELGYGQFIWQSANYLTNDDLDEPAGVNEPT